MLENTTGVTQVTTPNVLDGGGVQDGVSSGSANDDKAQLQSGNQEGEGKGEVQPYTLEELQEIIENDGEVDRKRLTVEQLAIQKTFEKGYTPKFQEAAALKKEAERILEEQNKKPEVYYRDETTNNLFHDYLNNPRKVTSDIHREIEKLEDVMDSSTKDTLEYQQAKKLRRQWSLVLNDFSVQRQEVLDKRRSNEITKLQLGEDLEKLEVYAVTLGFSKEDFKSKPELRKTVKNLYELANAESRATKKEVKTTPTKLATQSASSRQISVKTNDPYTDPRMSSKERIDKWKEERRNKRR